MNSKRRQRNNGESADRHQIENTEARKKTGKEIWTLMCCALFSVSSCFLQGVQVESGREGGDPQLRHGSCQEIHKERGRSPSSQTWFLSRDTQREREVTLKSDMVPVKRYTKREGGHPQVRHGSCQEIHKERGR